MKSLMNMNITVNPAPCPMPMPHAICEYVVDLTINLLKCFLGLHYVCLRKCPNRTIFPTARQHFSLCRPKCFLLPPIRSISMRRSIEVLKNDRNFYSVCYRFAWGNWRIAIFGARTIFRRRAVDFSVFWIRDFSTSIRSISMRRSIEVLRVIFRSLLPP